MKLWLKSFTHNCIVHPLMMFIPKKWAHELHDRNADWAFDLNRYDELKLEKQKWLRGYGVKSLNRPPAKDRPPMKFSLREKKSKGRGYQR